MSPRLLPHLGVLISLSLPQIAYSTVELDLPSRFVNLDSTMPASFEVGQFVDISIEYNEDAIGVSGFFPNAITSFTISVPEAGFSMSGMGDALTFSDGSVLFDMSPAFGLDPTFQGQEFERAEIEFFPGTVSVASTTNLPTDLELYELITFQVVFVNPEGVGTGKSFGSLERSSVPEPAGFAAILGCAGLVRGWLFRRQRRR
ncbi:MAG: hypothetical protein ACFBZ8_10690 [Opitutales bacterium]